MGLLIRVDFDSDFYLHFRLVLQVICSALFFLLFRGKTNGAKEEHGNLFGEILLLQAFHSYILCVPSATK